MFQLPALLRADTHRKGRQVQSLLPSCFFPFEGIRTGVGRPSISLLALDHTSKIARVRRRRDETRSQLRWVLMICVGKSCLFTWIWRKHGFLHRLKLQLSLSEYVAGAQLWHPRSSLQNKANKATVNACSVSIKVSSTHTKKKPRKLGGRSSVIDKTRVSQYFGTTCTFMPGGVSTSGLNT